MSDEHAAGPASEEAAHAAHLPRVNYWYVFAALCVLTVVSWLADEIGKGSGLAEGEGATRRRIILALVVLTVACFKAMFVMLYFMHLKFEGRWKFVLLGPTMILALAIVAALMPDIGSHYYDYEVPQLQAGAEAEEAPHGGGAPGGHGAAPQGH
jgi:cytochrome c oxidase subunit 4